MLQIPAKWLRSTSQLIHLHAKCLTPFLSVVTIDPWMPHHRVLKQFHFILNFWIACHTHLDVLCLPHYLGHHVFF